MKTYDQVVQELDSNIPREFVSERDGGSGFKLSYLEGWYVIDRMNQVFGHGNWAYTAEANPVYTGEVQDKYGNTVYTTHYVAKVRLAVKFPNGETTEFCDYGYGDGTDKKSPGKSHELAVKEAVTDGIKRCAKNLGMSMGLALYDKQQEFVGESNANQSTQSRGNNGSGERDGATATQCALESGNNVQPSAPKENKAALFKAITSTSIVAIKQGKVTKEELQEKLKKDYGVDSKESLPYPKAKEFLNYLKEVVNANQQ